MSTLGVMVGQLVPWPGKRRLRGEVAGFEAEEVEAGRERIRRGVVAAVERAYVGLVLTRQLLALTAEQEEVWKQIEGVARARYGVGQGAQQDVLRVQVELTRTHQQRAELDGEARIRSAELHRLLGRSPGPPLETATGLELVREPARPREEALVRAEETSPELQGAAAATQRAVRLAELARKDSWPDLGIQAGYMNRGRLDSMWQAGLSANLPLRGGRRAAARAEAEARVRASERRREALRLQLRYRTEERLAQLETAETLARLYGEGIVPQDQMSVEAAVANYQAGKVPFVAVLEALNSLYADRATYLRVVAGQHLVRASLEEASLDATSALAAGSGMSGRGAAVSAGNASGASPMTGMGQ
jgi:outer membrane protein TolC